MRHRSVPACAAVAVAMLLAGLVGSAHADWYDDFTDPAFDARWNFDVPDAGRGNVWHDPVADTAHFTAYSNTDM